MLPNVCTIVGISCDQIQYGLSGKDDGIYYINPKSVSTFAVSCNFRKYFRISSLDTCYMLGSTSGQFDVIKFSREL